MQIIKNCRVCGHEREYDNYHRLYVACKKCASRRCAKHYPKNREKILEKGKLYRENNKDKLKQNRKTVSLYKDDIQDLYNQINTLTEMMKSTTLVAQNGVDSRIQNNIERLIIYF